MLILMAKKDEYIDGFERITGHASWTSSGGNFPITIWIVKEMPRVTGKGEETMEMRRQAQVWYNYPTHSFICGSVKEIIPGCSLEGRMLKLKLQSCGEMTHWKRLWCWEGLGAGGEGDDRGWDGWMASPTQWTWVWVNSGSWWWTGRPGVLQFMGSQRVGHDWATKLNWIQSKSRTRHSMRKTFSSLTLNPVLFISY